MPYKSDAQRRFFHSKGAQKAGITESQVQEFDQASKGKKLPERVRMADGGNVDNGGFKFIDEGDKYFTLAHPSGTEFTVAKDPLDDAYRTRIRELPRADVPEPTPAPMPVPQPQPTLNPTVVAALQPAPPPLNPAVTEALAQPNIPAQPSLPAQQGGIGQDYQKAFEQAAQGIQAGAAAQSHGNQAQAQAQDAYIKQLAETKAYYDQRRRDLDNETDRLQKDVQDSKVDPSRWWNQHVGNAGFGKKALAAVGFILGGFAPGGNPMGQTIDNMIREDIDAQKAGMDKKQNLLRLNYQKYGDLQQAETATSLTMQNMLAAQISKIASQTNSQVVKANAMTALSELNLKIVGMKQQLAMHDAMNNMMGGANVNPELLPEEMRKRLVRLPNGNFVPARDDKSAEEISKAQEATTQLGDTIKEMEAFMEGKYRTPEGETLESPRSYVPFIETERKTAAHALMARAENQVRALGESIRLNPEAHKFLGKLIPDVSAIRQGHEKIKLQNLKNYVQSVMNDAYAARTFNYNPRKFSAR